MFNHFIKRKYTITILLILSIVLSIAALKFYPRWEKPNGEATISWDVSGYYMYLPASLIYHDIKKCSFKDTVISKYHFGNDIFDQAWIFPQTNNYVMKYASGQSIIMLPGFLMGDWWAKHSDGQYPADGFSYPYQKSVGVSLFIFSLLGLWILAYCLSYYYPDKIVATVITLIAIGSSYLNTSIVDQGMTHGPLFTISSAIILLTINYYKSQKKGYLLFAAFLCGLATQIRPTDITLLIIPFLWGVTNISTLKSRLYYIWDNKATLILCICAFALGEMGQLIYWKYVTNHWIVYSYQDQGFSWLPPHTIDYLFSPRAGWWLYNPLMILPFIGLFYFVKAKYRNWAVILVIFLNLYLVTAWDIWDYGGSPLRVMVQTIPLLSFPFALLLIEIQKKGIFAKLALYIFIAFGIYMNLWWTYNAHLGKILMNNTSYAYYWHTLGRWNTSEDDLKYINDPDQFRGAPNNVVKIWKKGEYNFDSSITITPPKNASKNWFRLIANYELIKRNWDTWTQPELYMDLYKNGNKVRKGSLKPDMFLGNNLNRTLFFDIKATEGWDSLIIRANNPFPKENIKVDSIQLIYFDGN